MINIQADHFLQTERMPTPRQVSNHVNMALVFTQVGGVTITTRHSIKNNVLLNGVPVDAERILESVVMAKKQAVSTEHKISNDTCLNPSNLLLEDSQRLIWFEKAQTRTMWFSVGRRLQLKVRWPAVLFVVAKKQRTMRVFALASNQRPHKKTKLYRAPFMNIASQGNFCLGSATLPSQIDASTVNEMGSCLYDSNFSHLNEEDNQHPFFKNDASHLKQWRALAKSKKAVIVSQLPYIGRLFTIL